MSLYELAIVGAATPDERVRLTQTLSDMVSAFGLAIGRDVVLRNGGALKERDIRAATAAAYFGGANHADLDGARELLRASVPIIPTVSPSADFATAVPDFLHALNSLRCRCDDVSFGSGSRHEGRHRANVTKT